MIPEIKELKLYFFNNPSSTSNIYVCSFELRALKNELLNNTNVKNYINETILNFTSQLSAP